MNEVLNFDYQTLFKNIPDCYLILLPDYTIADASDLYLKYSMTTKEDLLGKNIFTAFPNNPSDIHANGEQNLKKSLEFVIRNKIPQSMAVQKYDIQKPDGNYEVRYWSPVNSPVLSSTGELLYIIHKVTDVTEFITYNNYNPTSGIDERLRVMEIEIIERAKEIHELNSQLDHKVMERTDHLKRANEIIEQTNATLTVQKKQLQDFCNIISHNLRAPLINMSMLVEMITDNPNEDEKTLLLDKLNKATQNLSDIFNELVESIQIKEDNEIPSDTNDLNHITTKIVESLQGEVKKSNALITFDFSLAPYIYCPSSYIKSVLHNLISNSLKYKASDRVPEINIRSISNGDSIIISVSDNGLGIDLKEHQNNLFKIRKVFHSHPDAKGFGLFITKSQIDAMGGKIWVESTPNIGTTFYVELKNKTYGNYE